MSIIINEMKRIFKLKHVLIAVIFLLLTGMIFPGEFIGNIRFINKTHTDNYPEQIPLDFNNYSLELMFKDMILEKYGETIDRNELDLIKSQFKVFFESVFEAVEKDELLKKAGLVINDEYEFVSIYSPDECPVFSDEEQQYQWECVNGTKRLEGTEYPLYFLKAFQDLISNVEANNKNIYVMSTTLIGGIADNTCIVFMSVIAMLFLIVPYAIDQKRNDIVTVGYSSKTGRKIYLYKLISVLISSSIFIGIFVLFSAIIFKCYQVQRYYHCIIDSNIFQEYSIKSLKSFYSGMSFLSLYVGLILFIYICGVLVSEIAYVISSKFDNVISSIAACIPILIVSIMVFYRYIVYALDLSKGALLFRFEPVLIVLVLCIILTVMVMLSYRKQKKYDI